MSCLRTFVLLISLTLIAQATAETAEAFYFEDDVPEEFGQERSLNFLNVQLPSKQQPQQAAAFQLNSLYMPKTFMDYYSKPMHFVPQRPQYAYNAPLFPAPAYYAPSTNIDHFIKPSILSSFEAINKPSAESNSPVVLIKPNSQRPATSKPVLQENLTQLFNNLINKPTNDYNLYNPAILTQKEQLEVNQVNTPSKAMDKISALFTLPDKKPEITMPGIIKPESYANLKPTLPTTSVDSLLENLLQQLLKRKRTEERLGAFYLRNSLMNRK